MLERSPVIVRSTRPLIRSKRYNSYRYSTSIVKCCMCEERERERGNANLRFPNVSSTGDYRAFQAFSERHIKCHHRLRDRIRDDGRRRIRGATRSLNEVDPKTPSVCLPFSCRADERRRRTSPGAFFQLCHPRACAKPGSSKSRQVDY